MIDPFRRFMKRPSLERRPDGTAICKAIGCDGTPTGRMRCYCSQACREDTNIRCGQAIRYYVRKRDHGVCAVCGVDTSAQPYRGVALWEADHIIPVTEGGGCCGLDNYQTLCRPCHVAATAELRQRLSKSRKRNGTGRPRKQIGRRFEPEGRHTTP